jgi:4-amino-4-deoxy-L-arabinose transferase-like glycosyltransferase
VENRNRHPDPLARLILALALGLGALRFLRLGEWSLWFDEALTWSDAQNLAEVELHNTLGYHAIHAFVQLCGGQASEWNLRLLPAIAGWLVIPAAAWSFRPLGGERRAAAAALLVAVSSWSVYWSQNARFYTHAQLLAVLGVGLALRGLFGRRHAATMLGTGLIALASLFHPSAALLLPALLAMPLLLGPLRLTELERIRRPAWVLALAVLAMLALAAPFLLDSFATYRATRAAFYPAHLALTIGFFFTPLLCVAALLGTLQAWRERNAGALCIAALCIAVLLCAFLLSTQVRVSAQYVFVLLPFVALLAVQPLSSSLAFSSGYLGLLALPGLASTVLYFTVRNGERPHWREAFQYVWDQRGETDLILAMEGPVGEFYLDPRSSDLRESGRLRVLSRFNPSEVRAWADSGRGLWLVFNRGQLEEWNPAERAEFERFLAEECRAVRAWPLMVESRDLSVEVYRR